MIGMGGEARGARSARERSDPPFPDPDAPPRAWETAAPALAPNLGEGARLALHCVAVAASALAGLTRR